MEYANGARVLSMCRHTPKSTPQRRDIDRHGIQSVLFCRRKRNFHSTMRLNER
jgi:hypothetical protein